MFEKLTYNLNLLMTDMRISAEELARRTRVPASTIKKLRNEKNANPTLATLIPLAEFFSLSLGQFVGDEPMPMTRNKGAYKVARDVINHVPVLTWQEALNAKTMLFPDKKKTISEYATSAHAYALIVEEDNWENLPFGTSLVIDPETQAAHRDLIVVTKKGQLPTVKQILLDEDTTYLKPLVAGYQTSPLTSEHEILGVVVEFKKCLKTSPDLKETILD